MRSVGWVAVGLLREAVRRLHRGWEALPREARRRWWLTLGVGMAGVLALTAGVVEAGRRLEAAGALAWEREAVYWFGMEAPLSFSFAMWLEGPGNGFVLWGVVLTAAWAAAWLGHPLRSLAFLLGYTLLYLPLGVGWWMWERERPQIIAGGIGSPGGFFHAYPSGHTVQAVVAYGLLAFLWMRAARSAGERLTAALLWLLVVSAVVVGRLRVGAHWPSDMVAGFLVGLAWVAVVALALHRAERAARRLHPSSP